MPKFDGTGPRGLGSGTGRGHGMCNNNARRGQGFGFGRGRGLGQVDNSEIEDIKLKNQKLEQEIEILKNILSSK